LEPARQQALIKVFQNIPKPSELLVSLVMPEQTLYDSAAEMAAGIRSDQALLQVLLDDINAPGQGLSEPVRSVEEAIEALGVAAVRGLSLRCLLMRSFASASPQRQRLLDGAWQAVSLATEIGIKQARALGYADGQGLVTLILLAYVGRLATVAAMPGRLLEQIPARGYLARASAEQAVFGLSSAEIGRLLMRHWGLPCDLVDEAAEVEAVLFAPYAAWDADRASRLALAYLALRLGERLAHDPGSSLDDFDLLEDQDPEFHHVRAYLQHPGFAAVDQHLAEVGFRSHIDRIRLALLTPRLRPC
jgi:HD-like signal output (HDOD) protein